MKIFASLVFATLGSFAFAQNVQDYAFVAPAAKFKDFNDNKYGLSNLLSKTLQKKNYVLLSSDRMSWPAEAAQNPCNVLTADLINSSSMLKNKVKVALKDCNDKIVAIYEGASSEKEFETGYPDALNKALANLPASAPTERPVVTQTVVQQQVSETAPQQTVTQQTTANTTVIQQSGNAEVYSMNGMNLNRITLSADQFILANPNNSVPYAVFKQSGKPGIFHVKLQNCAFALGYFENGKIVVEMPNSDGTVSRNEFLRK